jgi:septum formation protein
VPFEVFSPEVDEAPRHGEPPEAAARRLAQEKAQAGAARYPDALLIGSDQVAEIDGERLDKPGTFERAAQQLARVSGRFADFHTAVALLNSRSGAIQTRVVPTRVHFRALTARQIEAYLRKEPPFDCAGSAKSEGLGIALIRRIEATDPTALIGLPLIALTEMLQAEGVDVI